MNGVLARPALVLCLAAGVCLVSCASPSSPSPTTEAYPAATGQSDSNALDVTATPPDGYPLGASSLRPTPPPPSTPTASATSTGTLTPMPTVVPTQLSALVIDSAAARVYGSLTTGTSADLLIYNAKDARLIERSPLEPGEVLLGMNGEGRRLYVYRPDRGVRLLNADSLEAVGNLPLPTPDPSDAKNHLRGKDEPLGPLIRPGSGQVLTFHGSTVTAHDPETGVRAWDVALPFANEEGPIYRAAVSDDGRLLYLGVASWHLADWNGEGGTIVLAVDLDKNEVLERRELHANVSGWLSWGDSLVVSTGVYKDLGLRHSFWIGGQEKRQIFESELQWTAYDARRDRLVGSLYYRSLDDDPLFASADAKTLDLLVVNRTISATELSGYDAVTDQLYGWSDQIDHLSAIAASSLSNESPTQAKAVLPTSLTLPEAFLPAGRTSGRPPLLLASMKITPGPLTPTPPWGPDSFVRLFSRDGGSTWLSGAERMRLYGSDFDRPQMSPAFDQDNTLFGLESGLGVFRSRDRGLSWLPVMNGLNGLAFMGLAISPNFASDPTLVATTFRGIQSDSEPLPSQQAHVQDQAMSTATSSAPSKWRTGKTGNQSTAWRSRDSGDHWMPIGQYAGVLFAPQYDGDRTLMAFGYLDTRFYVSRDGGDHWEARGRIAKHNEWGLVGTHLWFLPANERRPRVLMALGNGDTSLGGQPHWPESDVIVFRSVDEGWNWTVAWDWSYIRGKGTEDGMLMGPIPGNAGDLLSWILELWGADVLLTRDDGLHWAPAHISDDSEAYPLAVLPNGMILVSGASEGKPREVPLKAFEDLPTPTPTAD